MIIMHHRYFFKYSAIIMSIAGMVSFQIASADFLPLAPVVTQAAPSVSPITKPSPLGCFDFTTNMRLGARGNTVRHLQYALLKEGFDIPAQEFGMFADATVSGVKGFQQRYAAEVLTPAGLLQGNGYLGKGTRAKLNALYGCDVMSSVPVIQSYTINQSASPAIARPTSVNIGVSATTLDGTGATVTVCNKGGSDLPTVPLRIRLNGINRDFEILGAQKVGVCDTETFAYATWGLTYDPGATFTAISIIDPNGYYKDTTIQFSVNATTTLSVPTISGAHLSVRSVLIRTIGIQSTLCNLGSDDLGTFPVRVTVNGTYRDFDISSAYKKGVCTPVTWPYATFNLSYAPNTVYTVMIQVDPNNIIKETNEFDNSAVAIGMP